MIARGVRRLLSILLAMLLGLIAEGSSSSAADYVSLPVLENDTVSPRIVYVENPRFPNVSGEEISIIVEHAADLVKEYFGVTVDVPSAIHKLGIDDTFEGVVSQTPEGFEGLIGDFKSSNVDWAYVKELLVEQIESYPGALEDQISFAMPHLLREPASRDTNAFADAVVDTFKSRLSYWTEAKLEDGNPIIGDVPGRPSLPVNEYGYWTLMAKLGVDAEIVLTNQFIASVEYIPTPVHTAIRGGITGGSTEYNPASKLGATVWMSLAPFLMDDKLVTTLRNGKTYSRADALRYAGILLAHELGHLLLHLGHPWSNSACLMRPAEVLDFAAWADGLDAKACPIGSDPEMTKGVLNIPIW